MSDIRVLQESNYKLVLIIYKKLVEQLQMGNQKRTFE